MTCFRQMSLFLQKPQALIFEVIWQLRIFSLRKETGLLTAHPVEGSHHYAVCTLDNRLAEVPSESIQNPFCCVTKWH